MNQPQMNQPRINQSALAAAEVLLGVSASTSLSEIRVAYRLQLLRTHPDVSSEVDASERTMELTRAYLLLISTKGKEQRRTEARSSVEARVVEDRPERLGIHLLDDLTLCVDAPADETLMLLIEMANNLGEIRYLDPSAGLIELVIEFIEEPTSSVLLSLQGRATGCTEVFCSVEPLSGGGSPPSDAVARLFLRTLRALQGNE